LPPIICAFGKLLLSSFRAGLVFSGQADLALATHFTCTKSLVQATQGSFENADHTFSVDRRRQRKAPAPFGNRRSSKPGFDSMPDHQPRAHSDAFSIRSTNKMPDEPCAIPLADVFRAANQLVSAGLIEDYALGGALAAIYYTEPFTTYDANIIFIASDKTLSAGIPAIYSHLQSKGWRVEREHLIIKDFPVQFLAAPD
jgi:hypothetical protein